MGQTLSEPVTSKETTACANEQVSVGASCMQGWRITMEDSHTHILSLSPQDASASFFAVYDGHGGQRVAQYAGSHLHKKVLSQPSYQSGQYEEAIKQGFLELDQDMLCDPEMKDELAGTTAICMLIKNNKLHVGNAGDSRAVACWSGKVDALSQDHKPSNESETSRIIAAGGWVDFNRVNGNLALSRALGDFVFKRNEKKSITEQIVIALPDVEVRTITDELEFVVLACDGIWDVLTNEEVVDFIRSRIAEKMEPAAICEQLMTRCLAPDCQMGGLGCDNMTVVLVCFLHGRSYEELAAHCSQSLAKRNRLDSTESSDSLPSSTSCSFSTPETPDDETAKTPVDEVVACVNLEQSNTLVHGGAVAVGSTTATVTASVSPKSETTAPSPTTTTANHAHTSRLSNDNSVAVA